jgi:hypothetical protein
MKAKEKRGEEEARKSYLYVPFWSTTSKCFEAALVDWREAFLTFNSGKFEVLDELELSDEQGLKPVEYTQTKYSFTQEQIDSTVVPSLPQLYEDVYSFFRDYWAHFDPRIQKFLALYLIHSYVLTKSPGTIFVWLVGQKRTGKTTAQLIAEALGYRAFSGVAPSEAALYRTLGFEVEHGPLIICREYEHASDVFKEIVREGDIPGATVPRADKIEDRFVVNHYHLYGSRINGSNSLHGNEADMDRFCVIKCVHLQPLRPRVELYRSKDVIEKIRRTRNDLLLWKLANWSELRFPLEDPAGEIVEGRDWEHYGGVITLAGAISAELGKEIRDFVNERLAEGREEERYQLRAQLVEIIRGLADEKHRLPDGGCRIEFNEIWAELKAECTPFVENGVEVQTKLIGGDGEVITTHKVGKIIREQLFGERHVWKDDERNSIKGYAWTAEKLSYALGTQTHTSGTPGFTPLEAPTEGTCSYCGEVKEVVGYLDGSVVCSTCKEETLPKEANFRLKAENHPPSTVCLPFDACLPFLGQKETPKTPVDAENHVRNNPQNIPPGSPKNGRNGRQIQNGRQTVTNSADQPYTPSNLANIATFSPGVTIQDTRAVKKPSEAHVIHPWCEDCGVELGTAPELSVYTLNKKHYCKQHFEAHRGEAV